MTKSKDFRKSLKGPDEFQTRVAGSFEALYKYRTAIVGAISVLAVVAGGVVVWDYYQDRQREGRQAELGAFETSYNDAETAIEEKRQELRAELAKITGDKKGAKKKREDIQKRIAALKADHSGVLASYQSYFEANQSNAEGWLAGMRAVSILLQDKKFAEARPLLETVVEKARGNIFYQTQGRLVLTNILEELKEYDAALEQADVLLLKADEKLKPQLLLIKGRLQMAKNATAEAGTTFDSLIKDHGESPEAQKARGIKSLLTN